MAIWLRQSTATTVQIGPFVEASDGYSYKATTITVASGTVLYTKEDNSSTGIAVAPSLSLPGWMTVPLAATDTGQAGKFIIRCGNVTSNLPVWREYLIVPQQVYDSLILGSANLAVNAVSIAGQTPTSITFNAAVLSIAAGVGVNVSSVNAGIGVNVSSVNAGVGVNVSSVNAGVGVNASSINGVAATSITFNANVLTITGGAVSAATINANMIAINNGAPTTITFNANLLTVTGNAPSTAILSYFATGVLAKVVTAISANVISVTGSAVSDATFGAKPLLDYVMFTPGAQSITLEDTFRVMAAALAGRCTGATGTAMVFHGPSGEARVSAALASGNRTGTTWVTGP